MALEKEVKVIVSAVDRYSSVFTNFGSTMTAAAGSVLALEAAFLAASVAAATLAFKMGTEIFESSKDFHDAIFDVTAVTGEFGASQEEVSDILDDLVNKFPVTGKEAGEAMEQIAQMGYTSAEALQETSDAALQLTIATGIDLETAVKDLTVTMNLWGEEAGGAEHIMNVLSEAQFKSAMTAADYAEAIKYAGSTSVQAGFSFEETAAAMAMLTNSGLEASQVGTTFTQAMSKLTKETDAGRVALEGMGLTYEDLNPDTKSLGEIIEVVAGQQWSFNDAVDVFGIRGAKMAASIETNSELFFELTESMKDSEAGMDAFIEKSMKFDVVMGNLEGTMDIFKKTIGDDMVQTMAAYIGYTTDDGIRGVITKLEEMEEAHGAIGGPIADSLELFGELAGEMFDDAFEDMPEFYEYLALISDLLGTNVEILSYYIVEIGKVFLEATSDSDDLKVALEILNIAIGGLAFTIAFVHDAFTIAFYEIELAIDAVQWVWYALAQSMYDNLEIILQGMDALPWVDMTEEIKEVQRQSLLMGVEMEKAFDSEPPTIWTDNVYMATSKAKAAIEDFGKGAEKSFQDVTKEVKLTGEAELEMVDGLDAFNYQATTAQMKLKDVAESAQDTVEPIKLTAENMAKIAPLAKEIADEQLATKSEVELVAGHMQNMGMDSESIANNIRDMALQAAQNEQSFLEVAISSGMISEETLKSSQNMGDAAVSIKETADGSLVLVQNMVEVKDATEDTKKSLDEASKLEMEMEIEKFKSDLKIAEIEAKATHETIQTQIEWEAKVDIAEIQASADVAEAAFDNVAISIAAVSDATASMFTIFADMGQHWSTEEWAIYELFQQHLAMQQALIDSQVRMNDAQIELWKQQEESLKKGDPIYTINVAVEGDTDGWLAGLISSLLEEVVVKANAESFQCLCTS